MSHATTVVGYVYNGDHLCPDCANAICTELIAQGKRPSRDSDEWPQPLFAGFEADAPTHCNQLANCLAAITLASGRLIGAHLEDSLTAAGLAYTTAAIKQGGPVATEVWAPAYNIPAPSTAKPDPSPDPEPDATSRHNKRRIRNASRTLRAHSRLPRLPSDPDYLEEVIVDAITDILHLASTYPSLDPDSITRTCLSHLSAERPTPCPAPVTTSTPSPTHPAA